MENITSDKLFNLYKSTIASCGTYILSSSENVVAYNIFEELDIGAVSFLHQNSLIKLLGKGYISEELYKKSTELSDMIKLLKETEWNISKIKTSSNWLKAFILADDINIILASYNTV